MESNEKVAKIPCCPELIKDDNCDIFFFTQTINYLSQSNPRLPVQLIFGFKFSRCTLGLVLGDPVYTTTLLPGEKVRLTTTDRRSSFVFDSSTNLSFRSEQISEEQYYMRATQSYFSDYQAQQSGSGSSTDKGHWDFHGDASASINPLPFIGGADASTNASGSHDNSSTFEFLNRQSSNMRSSASQAVQATHMAHSVSMGEVSTRAHAEGQTEDHFESSSREFSNLNSCHAVSYIFYRLNKKQVVKFELVSVDVTINPFNRSVFVTGAPANPNVSISVMPELLKELKTAKIIDEDGVPSQELKRKFDFEMEFSLPTAGIQVKGCLDECNTCEPARQERVKLENELLKRQIELLDKSQEYRCCPGAAVTEENV